MPAEQFANLAETALASSYTAGGTTLSVTSSASFPAHGPFRVRIGNSGKTIWRVDVVFGTTWYGGAEFNDANANSADTITLVLTEASAERMIQAASDPIDKANPSGVAGGDLYSQFGGFKVLPLDQSNWTWFNQGSATVNQRGKLVNLVSPSAGGTALRGRLRGSYPATPFTITLIIQPFFQSAGNISALGLFGMTVSDGTKHKILVASNFNFNTANPPAAFWVGKYNSSTSASSATVIDSMPSAAISVSWLRMTDDGTNQTFYFSFDGINFFQILQEARTTFLTPSDIGIVLTNQSGDQTIGGNVLSWEILPYILTESTPLGGALTITGKTPTLTIT